jgi:hypothetical protein
MSGMPLSGYGSYGPGFVLIGVGAYELARRIGAVPSGIGRPHGAVAAALPMDESH